MVRLPVPFRAVYPLYFWGEKRYSYSMNKETTLLRLDTIGDELSDLAWCNGYWAGELTFLGCAVLFELDIPDEDLIALAEALWDTYTEEDLVLLAAAVLDRPADPETLTEGELAQVAERFGADYDALVEALTWI